MYDVVIIGAGPAGLTAAVYALRAEKSVLVIEKSTFGGQITYSPKIENFPGFISLSGNELADKMVEQVLNLGGEIEVGKVVSVESCEGFKRVITADGETYEGKAVIIAVGVKHRMLGLEKETQFVGEGISFCAVCDGAFYKGKTVAVIGGGNSALQEAIMLSEGCEKVYVVQNLGFLTGEAKLAQILETKSNVEIILNTTVKALLGESCLVGIEVTDEKGTGRTLVLDGLFIAIGLVPENGAFAEHVSLTDGYITADEKCLTDTAGIFVAGDCRTKSVRQITTAVADGATAALAACRYIDSL